MFIFLLGCAD